MSDQTRKLAAIVFTDLAGFSELSSSDENLAIELVNTQHEIIQPLIETYNGVLHKKTGDGFLLTFPTATSAIEFSIDFQRAVKHVDGLNIRIGIHEGEITVQNDDVFGDDVNIAARIESYSPVGGIAISEKVKLELGSLPEYETAFIGEPELKGIKQPVKIYCISSHGLVSPYNKVDDSLISEQKKGFRFNVLSLTGIVLMIIGGIFWAWYGFGNITHGSDDDLAGGIKKSIAVINFQNLSGEKAGDHYCSAISEYIRSVLIKLGKLDVKRLASKNNEPNDLGLDYYIEGTLAEIEGKRNIYVYLVDAKSKSYLRTFPYQLVDEQILAYQDTIIKNILIELNIDPSENELISNKSEYGTVENFKLIGEGLLNFDNKNYIVAMEAFDSVLESNPKNMIANFHKANTYFELNKNDDAMNIYKDILSHTINIDPIQWHMPVPERNDMHPILCDNIELIEDKKLAIMLLKGNNGSRLMCINTATKDFVWEKPINDQFVSSPVIINNTVFLSSSRFKKEQIGEPTLFAFDISNGRQIFVREFPRDNPNQTVLFNISEEYSNISDNSSTILLTFDKLGLANESQKELVLIETAEGSTVWESKIEGGWGFWAHLMLINTKSTELLILILENDVVALNNKTGREMWRENFSGSGISAWNKKILRINPNEKYVAIWDPISRKDVWHYEHEFVYALNMDDIMYSFEEFRGRMNRDVVLLNFNNGNLIAVNYDGGIFNWNRERWTINVGYAEKIWFPEKMSNHIFCLTEDNLLFTINMSDGKIINSFATDGHDYNVYFDDSQNAMVLHNSEFLIGVDPLNGNQLWKIKDNGVDQARLVGNTILAAKTKLEDNLLLINAYNRDNGNLIWNKNINISASLDYLPKIGPMCGAADCAFCSDFNFFLEQYSDKSLFLVLHDEIIKMGAMQDKGVAVRQKDVRLKIAKTHEKRGELDAAIEEYKLLLFQDQMNPFAHWELANIYQKKNKVNEAAKSLINYYDLIFPESFEGTRTIQKLKDLNILKWNKNISRNKSDAANMDVDREKIFLFINNNIESHSIHSSSLIWENSFGDKNTSVVSTDVKNEKHIFFIKKDVPDAKMFYFQEMLTNKRLDFEAYDKASKYSIAAVDKRDGKISWDLPLEIPGESNITWMGVKSNKIFIQSMVSNKMSVSAHDVKSGTLIWKISRDISSFYKSYYLTPAFYKDLLLLPLATSIEYINAENGNAEGKYFDNDIDHIFSFNENSIQNNTMKFFIVEFENEYVEVDLEKNVKISGGVLDSDHPERGMWINNMFVDVSSSGSVAAYKLSTDTGGEALELWKYNYNSTLRLVGFDEQNISILDLDSERIIVVDAQSGTNLQSKPLLWPGEIVKMTGNYYIVQSENNLFVVPM